MQDTDDFKPLAPILWLVIGTITGFYLSVIVAPLWFGYELRGASASLITTICALVFFTGGLWFERLVWRARRKKSVPTWPMGA